MLREALVSITKTRIALGFLVLALIGSGYGVYYYYTKYQAEVLQTQKLSYESADLTEKLNAANTLTEDLKTLLQSRVAQLDIYGSQIQGLSSTVAQLDKLTKTDKQLLEKYSSVYFLNENYVPVSLTYIDGPNVARPERQERILTGIKPHLDAMMAVARAAGSPLTVVSAYRSFTEQQSLKSSYKVTYGAGTANAFSADQGYSEHQLGTTVDFSTPALNAALSGFDKTQGFSWLNDHAYEYGFILSYPKGNGYFVYEPWHWRYVGIELAKKLHDEGKHFYDLDQREIDTYLIKFFD